MRGPRGWLSPPRAPMLGATLGLALTLAGCASGGGDPHQATGAWAACAPSPPVAFTILCIQQRAVVSEK